MCYILYTLYICQHWVPVPQPGNGPILRICKHAETQRLGRPCAETEHNVDTRSQSMCQKCLWNKVSK